MAQTLTIVDPNGLSYPVLSFAQGIVLVQDDAQALTTCTKTALRNGYFDDLRVVESDGAAHRIRRAEKIRGVGRMWGYNIFLNQRIEVRLYEEAPVQHWSLEEVRSRVSQSLKSWSGWAATGELDELRDAVSSAPTIPALMRLAPILARPAAP